MQKIKVSPPVYCKHPEIEKLSRKDRIAYFKMTVTGLIDTGTRVRNLIDLIEHFKCTEQYEAAEGIIQAIESKFPPIDLPSR